MGRDTMTAARLKYAEVKTLLESGEDISTAAETCQITRDEVLDILTEQLFPQKGVSGAGVDAQTEKKIRDLFFSGMSIESIAPLVGLSAKQLGRERKKYVIAMDKLKQYKDDKIKRLVLDGMSSIAIAKACNVCTVTVVKLKKKIGNVVTSTSTSTRYSKEAKDKVKELLLMTEKPIVEIAKECNVSVHTVYHTRNKLNIPCLKPTVSAETGQLIHRLLMQGVPSKEIVKITGVSAATVTRRRAHHQIPEAIPRRFNRPLTPAKTELIRKLLLKGATVAKAAEAADVSLNSATKVFHKYGIDKLPGRIRRRCDPTLQSEIKQLLLQGMTVSQVVAATGVKKNTMEYQVQKKTQRENNDGRPWSLTSEKRDDIAYLLMNTDMSHRKIAKFCGVSSTTVNKTRVRLNLPPREQHRDAITSAITRKNITFLDEIPFVVLI